MSFYVLYLYIVASFSIHHAFSISNHPLILIVSFDGFRYDYLNRGLTPNLLNLQTQGVHSKYMKNIFPTKTYPNHQSIATGLYSEQHGVIDNHIFDPKSNKSIGYSNTMFSKSNVVPLYTLNELQGEGRYSGSMMWPGSDYKYQNHSITHNHLFDRSFSYMSRVDEVISWYLHKEKPANLVMLYFDEPDSHGHMAGPDAESVNFQIKRCDNIVKYLLDQLEKFHLKDRVNMFVLSDHGMTSVQVKDIIDLTKFIKSEDVQFGGGSPTLEIFPAKDKEEEIYAKLSAAAAQNKTFKIFRKADMPDRWHYKNSEHAPPLLALANINFAFQDLYKEFAWFKEYNMTVTSESIVGLHGYDNTELTMYPMFLAHGPLLKKNTQVPVFDNIDLFPLWCHMLKLSLPSNKGLEQSSGVFSNVSHILADDGTSAGSIVASVLLIIVVIGAVATILTIYENLIGSIINRFKKEKSVPRSNAESLAIRRVSKTPYQVFYKTLVILGVGWDLMRDGDAMMPVSIHNETVTGDYTVTTWQWKDPDGGIWDTRLKMSFKGGITGGGMLYRNVYGVECVWLRWVMRQNTTWRSGSTTIFPTGSWTVTTFDMTWSYVPTHDGYWFFQLNNMTFEPKIGGVTESPMESVHHGQEDISHSNRYGRR